MPLRVEDVTDFTSAPNAYAVGFGPSKRIVFWNTILDGSFTDEEVKTVLAHELGHISSGHLIEGIEWYALFALPGAWLIAVATRRRGGMANPAAVPLSLLVIVVLDLLSLPVYNLISRHMEAEADWKALETTHDPASAESPLQAVHDPVAERPRPADVVVPALRQPPLRRAADRDGRGLESRARLGKRVLGAGAALGRGQPAALGGDRAALDAVRRVHLDVHHPVAVGGAGLVDLRGAHVYPCIGQVFRDSALDPDVVRLVVARPVAREENGRELVERQLPVGRRIARRAVGADQRPRRRSARSRTPSAAAFPLVTVIALASAPPMKKPLSKTWRMFRTSCRSFST